MRDKLKKKFRFNRSKAEPKNWHSKFQSDTNDHRSQGGSRMPMPKHLHAEKDFSSLFPRYICFEIYRERDYTIKNSFLTVLVII